MGSRRGADKAGRPGLEPGLTEPKSAVLPITPSTSDGWRCRTPRSGPAGRWADGRCVRTTDAVRARFSGRGPRHTSPPRTGFRRCLRAGAGRSIAAMGTPPAAPRPTLKNGRPSRLAPKAGMVEAPNIQSTGSLTPPKGPSHPAWCIPFKQREGYPLVLRDGLLSLPASNAGVRNFRLKTNFIHRNPTCLLDRYTTFV